MAADMSQYETIGLTIFLYLHNLRHSLCLCLACGVISHLFHLRETGGGKCDPFAIFRSDYHGKRYAVDMAEGYFPAISIAKVMEHYLFDIHLALLSGAGCFHFCRQDAEKGEDCQNRYFYS